MRESDHDLENPSEGVRWRAVCRYCGRERSSGVFVSAVVFGAALVGGVVALLIGPPLLGAVLIIGSMWGLMWSVVPASADRVARWLGR